MQLQKPITSRDLIGVTPETFSGGNKYFNDILPELANSLPIPDTCNSNNTSNVGQIVSPNISGLSAPPAFLFSGSIPLQKNPEQDSMDSEITDVTAHSNSPLNQSTGVEYSNQLGLRDINPPAALPTSSSPTDFHSCSTARLTSNMMSTPVASNYQTNSIVDVRKVKASGEKLNACPHCRKTYQNLTSLKTHLLKHETGQLTSKRHKCGYCAYSSQYYRNLLKHISAFHPQQSHQLLHFPIKRPNELKHRKRVSSVISDSGKTSNGLIHTETMPDLVSVTPHFGHGQSVVLKNEPQSCKSQSIVELLCSESPDTQNLIDASREHVSPTPGICSCPSTSPGVSVTPGLSVLHSLMTGVGRHHAMGESSVSQVSVDSTVRSTSTAEINQCSVCCRSFRTKQKLNHHMDMHDERKPFICKEPDCERAFSTKKYLGNHMSDYHAKEKVFRCSIDNCQFLGTRQSQLKRHIADVHSTKSLFQCPIQACGRQFITDSLLNLHMQQHLPNSGSYTAQEPSIPDHNEAVLSSSYQFPSFPPGQNSLAGELDKGHHQAAVSIQQSDLAGPGCPKKDLFSPGGNIVQTGYFPNQRQPQFTSKFICGSTEPDIDRGGLFNNTNGEAFVMGSLGTKRQTPEAWPDKNCLIPTREAPTSAITMANEAEEIDAFISDLNEVLSRDLDAMADEPRYCEAPPGGFSSCSSSIYGSTDSGNGSLSSAQSSTAVRVNFNVSENPISVLPPRSDISPSASTLSAPTPHLSISGGHQGNTPYPSSCSSSSTMSSNQVALTQQHFPVDKQSSVCYSPTQHVAQADNEPEITSRRYAQQESEELQWSPGYGFEKMPEQSLPFRAAAEDLWAYRSDHGSTEQCSHTPRRYFHGKQSEAEDFFASSCIRSTQSLSTCQRLLSVTLPQAYSPQRRESVNCASSGSLTTPSFYPESYRQRQLPAEPYMGRCDVLSNNGFQPNAYSSPRQALVNRNYHPQRFNAGVVQDINNQQICYGSSLPPRSCAAVKYPQSTKETHYPNGVSSQCYISPAMPQQGASQFLGPVTAAWTQKMSGGPSSQDIYQTPTSGFYSCYPPSQGSSDIVTKHYQHSDKPPLQINFPDGGGWQYQPEASLPTNQPLRSRLEHPGGSQLGWGDDMTLESAPAQSVKSEMNFGESLPSRHSVVVSDLPVFQQNSISYRSYSFPLQNQRNNHYSSPETPVTFNLGYNNDYSDHHYQQQRQHSALMTGSNIVPSECSLGGSPSSQYPPTSFSVVFNQSNNSLSKSVNTINKQHCV